MRQLQPHPLFRRPCPRPRGRPPDGVDARPRRASDRSRDRSIVAYIDGGARGNPGPAGYGVRIEQPDGTLVEEFGDSIGVATNNVAEYRGLLAALEWARAHGTSQLHVRSDSLLLVQQMLGNYKVKNAGPAAAAREGAAARARIGRVTFEHVRRESNAHADRLANAAMDEASGKA